MCGLFDSVVVVICMSSNNNNNIDFYIVHTPAMQIKSLYNTNIIIIIHKKI